MLLTIIVPCYNAQGHMARCLDSLLAEAASMEILIINDGSTDATGTIAEAYARRFPDRVRVFHQENGGHGAGVMKGLAHARGRYCKVVDSDDWMDTEGAWRAVLQRLAALEDANSPDVVICNYTRVHQSSGRRHVARFASTFPQNRILSWNAVGRPKIHQPLMMHAVFFRTALLRACNLVLPRHTYYVDLLILHIPLLYAKTLRYWDISPYQYLVGQAQQSINVRNVIRNIDDMLLVTNLLVEAYVARQDALEPNQKRLLRDGIALTVGITSVHLMMCRTPEAYEKLTLFWETLRRRDERLLIQIRRTPIGFLASASSPFGRWVAQRVYFAVDRLFHIN